MLLERQKKIVPLNDIQLDDRCTSIGYSPGGNWTQAKNANSFNNTLTETATYGASATLKFKGSGISVYGFIYSEGKSPIKPVSNYIIDGDTPVQYTGQHAQLAKDVRSNVQFFQSGNLAPNVEHTLVVTAMTPGAILSLDSFVIKDGSVAPLEAPGNDPLLIGAVVGGILALALAILACAILARRRILARRTMQNVDPFFTYGHAPQVNQTREKDSREEEYNTAPVYGEAGSPPPYNLVANMHSGRGR